MNALAKLIAQVLLLVLPKIFDEIVKYFKKKSDNKKLEEENKKKGEAYETATPATSHDEFSKLP